MKELKTRLPDALHAEAVAYAEAAGVSLNALLLLSLRRHLDVHLKLTMEPLRKLAVAEARLAEAKLRTARIQGALAGLPLGPVDPEHPRTRPLAVETEARDEGLDPEFGDEAEDVEPVRRAGPKVGRNDPCPCGSGRKFKVCHGKGG